MKYEVIIYWSRDDESYIAECPELPGCAADGKTQEEALYHLLEAIQLWIKVAEEEGRTVPEPKGDRLMYAKRKERISSYNFHSLTEGASVLPRG